MRIGVERNPMEKVNFEIYDKMENVKKEEFHASMIKNEKHLQRMINNQNEYINDLGWFHINEWANEAAVDAIIEKANQIRKDADVFVLIGIGGSNQAARAVIKAFQNEDGPEILYAGNNISAHYVNRLLDKLKGKSVYINVIAKNFETLEPGIAFRVLRDYLIANYGQEAYKRIFVTGTANSHLHQLAKDHNYEFLTFPENIGGRYSVFSDVGLFPMAVAGIDINNLLQGAIEMEKLLFNCNPSDNIALKYATYRNLLLGKGYNIEMFASFEPQFSYFAKWWIQLFAESEGKDGKGIYPVGVNYSEDLHSIGQYVQDGQKIIFETFIDVKNSNSSLILKKDSIDDRFDYTNDKDFWDINKAAFEATLAAHSNNGIPCIRLSIPELNEFYFGQLFYLFMFSCYLSGSILDINPFDQPGVEEYKGYMFDKLGKDNGSTR